MGCNCNGCPVRDVALMVIVIVEVPEGVMMGGGVVTTLGDGVVMLLPQPVAPITKQSRIAARAPLHAKRRVRVAPSSVQRFLVMITKSRTTARSGRTRIPAGGAKRLGVKCGSAAPPLVDTATVNGAGVPFASVTVAGAWQTAASGAPLQANDMAPL